MKNKRAVLTSENNYGIFKFDEYEFRFPLSFRFEKFEEIKEWDNGYIVVMVKYNHSAEPIEDYLDMHYVLNELGYDADKLLKPIEGVDIVYENENASAISF